MSRDDSGSFLPHYQELEIIKKNPFATIDQDGVGKLMKIAVEKGRKTRPDIKLGICGEHGGDPDQREVLPSARPDLRQLLALPRAGRPPGRRPGRARRRGRQESEEEIGSPAAPSNRVGRDGLSRRGPRRASPIKII